MSFATLQIRSASIQTTKDGTVHDVFEVRWDSPEDSPADSDEIRETLNEKLHEIVGSPQLGDKRRRY
jgi:UTP:GlnB (protein PII) uridylyltransferase